MREFLLANWGYGIPLYLLCGGLLSRHFWSRVHPARIKKETLEMAYTGKSGAEYERAVAEWRAATDPDSLVTLAVLSVVIWPAVLLFYLPAATASRPTQRPSVSEGHGPAHVANLNRKLADMPEADFQHVISCTECASKRARVV